MKLTEQQEQILATNSNIRVDAVAGSGKTTTLIAYAKSRPAGSSILYLAFNKSVKEQALTRFKEENITNVTVETAHSLAFKKVVIGGGYSLEHQSIHQLWAAIHPSQPPHLSDLLMMTHAQRFTAYFCNSSAQKVQELSYSEILSTDDERDFVNSNYEAIELLTRKYLAGMYKRVLPITHDFYLKMFHLQNPQLGYNYILFDEAQDASPVMIDIVDKQQSAIKVIAGDTHQQIYRWRHAKNAMRTFDYPVVPLTKSFRLPPVLANLASSILGAKEHFMKHPGATIEGTDRAKSTFTSRITIGRTNIGLLAAAISFLGKRRSTKTIFFEGNINSYLFGEEGGSLSDVLNLYNKQTKYIRNPIISQSKSIEALEEYAEKTGDVPMKQVIDLVKKHGDELPKMIAKLRSSHCDDDQKGSADMHFSTVHRCKGLEYDEVFLCDDFMSEKGITARIKKGEPYDPEALEEEVNLLYVAATRTKQKLHIPRELLPLDGGHHHSPHLSLSGGASSSMDSALEGGSQRKPREPRKRRTRVSSDDRKNRGVFWRDQEEQYLIMAFKKGISTKLIAETLERSPGAIRSRLKKCGLISSE